MGWPALDLLKCLCVMGMVLVHGFFWAWTDYGRFLLPPENIYFGLFQGMMFLGFFPLTLPLLAGTALRLRLAPAATGGALPPALLLQCCVLAALGYALNVLAAGWYALWAWNVLQLVAVSFGLIAVLYTRRTRRSIWSVAAAGLLVLALSDPLRAWLPPEGRTSVIRVALGDVSDWHSWPIFPWFSLVAFGFVLAHAYQRRGGDPVFRWGCALLGAGLVLIAAAAGRLLPAFDPDNLIGPSLMQPPALAVLGVLGVVLLLIAALTALQGRVRLARYGLVRCFSAGILWIYVIHMIVGLRLSRWVFHHLDRYTVVAEPWRGWHPVILLGLPVLLLLLSWLVGYLALRWLHEKRLRVQVRKVARVDPAIRYEELHHDSR